MNNTISHASTKDLRKKLLDGLVMSMPKRMKKDKKKAEKGMAPSVYDTMPHYFPTGQIDIVKKIRKRRKKK